MATNICVDDGDGLTAAEAARWSTQFRGKYVDEPCFTYRLAAELPLRRASDYQQGVTTRSAREW